MDLVRRFRNALVVLVITASCILGLAPSVALAVTGTTANVVVICRFQGDTAGDNNDGYNAINQYNNAYTEYDRFLSSFDQAEGYFDKRYSLAKYVADASDNQLTVKNYFPMATGTGHTTAYVTLPKTQSQYANESNPEYSMVRDAINGFDDAYDGPTTGWDVDNDGSIDNLAIIVQVGSQITDAGSFLWPHKYNLGTPSGCSVNGLNVNIYNVVNSEAVDDGATMAHEYLHSLGLGDLYRLGSLTTEAGFENANTPVGIWDIMAKAGFELPLAQSRADLGWTTIPAVTESGTYTLNEWGSGEGRNAFKVASPFSSDEYFVFEYRRKPTDLVASMTTPDKYISNSGLIVYRVNNSFGQKNNKSYDASGSYYRDYLYVFRPGETGIHSSAGKTMESSLSLGDAYKPSGDNKQSATFGSDDPSATISAGTICDSAGRNSLITVEVTAQDDDSVTFKLVLGDTTGIDLWDQVTSFASDAMGNLAMTTDDDGTTYVVDKDDRSRYTVRAIASDGTVTSLGVPFTSASGAIPMLSYNKGVLYCALPLYPGSNNSVQVKKYSGGTWSSVGSVSTGDEYAMTPTMKTLNGTTYLLVDTNNESAQLYKVGPTSVTKVGGILTGKYIQGTSLELLDGSVVVSYGDFDMGGSSNALRVARLEGNSWTEVGSVATTSRKTFLAHADDGTLLLLEHSDGKAPRIFTVSSSGLSEPVTVDGPVAEVDNGMSFAVQGEWAYVMVSQPDAALGVDVARVWAAKTSDLSSWQKVGEDAANPSSGAVMDATSSKVYVMSQNGDTYSTTITEHAVMPETTPPSEPTDISGATVSDIPSQTYTGSPIEPAVTVTLDGATLAAGTDYEVSFSNNTNVGTATVTITGKGDYAGTVTKNFTISNLPTMTLGVSGSATYDGKSHAVSVTCSQADATIEYSTDGGVTWSTAAPSRTNAGTTNVSVRATKSGYETATASYALVVKAASIQGASVALSPQSFVYNGSAQKPAVKVTLGGKELASTDYTVTYSNNINAGTAKATVTGKGNYAGTLEKTFTITAATLTGATVTLSPQSYVYDGAAKTPSVTVTLGDKKLASTNYTVAYSNNTNAGTAKATVTGKGNYAGKLEKTFTIMSATMTLTVTGGTWTYNAKSHSVAANCSQRDAKVQFSTNGGQAWSTLAPSRTGAGTTTVTVRASKKNYTTVTKTCKIVVNRCPAKVTAGNATKVGGTSDPAFSITVSGTLGSDELTYSLSRDPGEAFGTYAIKPTGATTQGNYSVTFVAGKLTIARAVERLWGNTALDTMSKIVSRGWADRSGGTVVLATNNGYWDALSASGIAGLADNASVLLTDGKVLSSQTRSQLARIKPSKIIVCGGTAAISDVVKDAAASAAGISASKAIRVWGPNATATAAAIARQAGSITGAKWSDTAFIATNDGYWDALSVGPAAYALHMPIFLTEGKGSVSSTTISAMKAAGITKFYIVGGTAAVSDSVRKQLTDAKFTCLQRLAGDNAVKTSTAVANWEMSRGMQPNGMAVATNDGYWDALTGAALCGKAKAPLVLVSDRDRSGLDFAATNKSKVTFAYVFGGKAAVSDASLNAFKAKLGM